ncbi:MAG: hypothetical protein HRT89_07070 [Lentisphaeria bacterium]|nr:hypothetical protein [Lentisphaeria bacterium]NQZ67814.1 hypothetical protein [Lentisphaeria bacterium]
MTTLVGILIGIPIGAIIAIAIMNQKKKPKIRNIEINGMGVPLNKFTPRAQQVLSLAKEEAERLRHNYLGTEHLLLGLIKLGQGVAVAVLDCMSLNLDKARSEVVKYSPTKNYQESELPPTDGLKTVVQFSAQEASALHYNYIGTEHLLLGLLREGEGLAGQVLNGLDIDSDIVRNEVLKALDPNYIPPEK